MTNTASLLSKKDQSLSDNAKVQKLVRIGRRATGNADHLENEMIGYYRRTGTAADVAQCIADVAKARAKAAQAADEAMAIASSSEDLTLRRRAGAIR